MGRLGNLAWVVALSLVAAGCASSEARRPALPSPPATSVPASATAGVRTTAGPAAGASGAVAADPRAAVPPGYLIGPEDILYVSVWKEDGLTRQVRVRPDGRISFPLVGDVEAAGLTASDLQADLTQRLARYVTAPAVSVIVDEINSYKVFVLGEVERPGLLPARAPVTVLQALALAGGLKPFAAGDRMVLVRQQAAKTLRVRLNYSDIVLGRNGAVNLTLQSGDTLVVP